MGLISDEYYECISRLNPEHILEVNCGGDQKESDEMQSDYRFSGDILFPSWHDKQWCRATISKWKRCNRNISYVKDVPEVFEYHYVLTKEKYRVLAYSGDYDMLIPYIGTIEWIGSLNLIMDVNWRPWFFDGETAGYTKKYKLHGYGGSRRVMCPPY